MAKKMTREERQIEREQNDALSFKTSVERERAKIVVNNSRDVAMSNTSPFDTLAIADMFYRAIYQLEAHRDDYATKLRWRAEDIAREQKRFEENYFGASVPMQNVDDLIMSYGRFYEALQNVVSLCRVYNVYYPGVEDVHDRKKREEILSYTVVQETDGLWTIKRGADYATMPGSTETLFYAEEWRAWRALRVLVHGR